MCGEGGGGREPFVPPSGVTEAAPSGAFEGSLPLTLLGQVGVGGNGPVVR